MRAALADRVGEMRTYRGRFQCVSRYHRRDGRWVETALLLDVIDVDDAELVTDHAWVRDDGRAFRGQLARGDLVTFGARARSYARLSGIDFKLTDVRDVRRWGPSGLWAATVGERCRQVEGAS